MNKISRIATLLVLAVSFSVPLLAAAQFALPGDNPGINSRTGTSAPTPGTVAAQGSVNQQWAQYYRDTIVWAVNSVLVPILFAVAFIVFLWGVYNYFILGADSEDKRKEGRQFVFWGVIGFVIISSVWGLVNIVKDTLVPSTASSTHPKYPTL